MCGVSLGVVWGFSDVGSDGVSLVSDGFSDGF